MSHSEPALYIDVDDTLILWGPEEGLLTKWRPNQAVIRFAREWRLMHPTGHLVVWSLGGAEYAYRFGSELLGHGLVNAFLDRYPRLAGAGELYLDDDPFDTYRCATVHPSWLVSP